LFIPWLKEDEGKIPSSVKQTPVLTLKKQSTFSFPLLLLKRDDSQEQNRLATSYPTS